MTKQFEDKPKEGVIQTSNAWQSIRSLSREQIKDKLKTLEAIAEPRSQKMGAMCYDMAPPPKRAEYVCPKCGERTLYSCGDSSYSLETRRRDFRISEDVSGKYDEETLFSSITADFLIWELEACRREINILKGVSDLSLTLDESSFCAHCTPSCSIPVLVLIVNYTDGSSHRTVDISLTDLEILEEFLTGKLSHEMGHGDTRPLKELLPRLRKLLGVAPQRNRGKK